MKRWITFIVIFFIFCAGMPFGVASITAYAEGQSAIFWPETSAASAVVMDGRTGRILYEKNGKAKQYMASTTKIMTALLALEAVTDETEMIRISENAAAQEGSSIYMEAGEQVSFRDLIYALMLRSGNDAAVALAEWMDGSEEAFADRMNRRAAEIGAVNTHFVTASGLHDEDHYTTAEDLALIAFESMKNRRFREIAGTTEWNASRDVDKFNYFYNKNKVLHQYEGGTGIKIGYTQAAGRCLVASSERNGIALICVVLNAGDWFNDTYKLMDTVYENYEAVPVAQAGTPLKTINVEHGAKDYTKLVAAEDTAIPLTEEEKKNLKLLYRAEPSRKAPIERGQALGSMDVYIDGEFAGKIPLVSREDIPLEQERAQTESGVGIFFSNLLKAVTNS